jgi:hypothetical protein
MYVCILSVQLIRFSQKGDAHETSAQSRKPVLPAPQKPLRAFFQEIAQSPQTHTFFGF